MFSTLPAVFLFGWAFDHLLCACLAVNFVAVLRQRVQWLSVSVRYYSLFISLPFFTELQWPYSAYSREREIRRLIFKIHIPNLTLRSMFNIETVLTVRNILNDLRGIPRLVGKI